MLLIGRQFRSAAARTKATIRSGWHDYHASDVAHVDANSAHPGL